MDDNSPSDPPQIKNLPSNLDLEIDTDDDLWNVDTRDREAGPDGFPVKLAEWSAQDFSNIYTRFRPYLERHARRFLRDLGQVDEVVQDAFLYLMVSLPELDSEIGVLRFLKWKTRLLCLDVIRASGKAYLANIDEVAEPVSQDPEVTSYLEQQDDAAVLRLALSKLNPRHREVLLASVYEEKSTLEIAAQVGLSENGTRQLIFRARSAFKKALLGDGVDTNGMSAAAILSVAARKAAAEAKKVGAQAMMFVLFLMLAIGAFVNFTGRDTQTQQVAQELADSTAPVEPNESAGPDIQENSEIVQIQKPSESRVETGAVKPSISPTPDAGAAPKVTASAELLQFAAKAAALTSPQTSAIQDDTYLASDKRQVMTVKGSPLSAKFEYSLESASISSLIITFELDGNTYRTYPYAYTVRKNGFGSVSAVGQLGYFVDSKSRIVTENPLQAAKFELNLQLDGSGKAVSADLKLIN